MKAAMKITFLMPGLLLALTAAITSTVHGAERLTLEEAVETALRNNPGLKAADSQVEEARAGVLRSSSGFLPRVSLSETWSRTDNPLMALGTKLNREIVSPLDFAPDAINDPEAISNYNTRLSVMQPVFSGGREYLGVKQARLNRDAALADRERSRQDTVFRVIKAYYGVLLAREYHRVAQQSLETSRENVRLAEARARAGAVLGSDVLRARVQEAEVKEMVTRSESGSRLAMANLNFAMGVSQEAEHELDGTLATRGLPPDLSEAAGKALTARPDLAALELKRRNAEAGVSQARTDYLPTFSVMGQADWNSDRPGGDEAKSWAVMAVLQWNLFDGLVTRSNVRQAAASAGRMRAMQEQMQAAVRLEVQKAYYDLQASLDRINTTSSSVQAAEEGLRIVQKRYEAGMTTLVDVLGAESALIRARTNALQSLYDNNIAEAELKLAMGTL